jgi:hypothetical protein
MAAAEGCNGNLPACYFRQAACLTILAHSNCRVPCGEPLDIPCCRRARRRLEALELEVMRVDFGITATAMALTAKEMNSKYKETSEGGLAVSVTLC